MISPLLLPLSCTDYVDYLVAAGARHKTKEKIKPSAIVAKKFRYPLARSSSSSLVVAAFLFPRPTLSYLNSIDVTTQDKD